MSLLIYTPTYADLMRPETGDSIRAQRTNVPWRWEVDSYNPYPGRDMRNVVAKYQRAWKMALDGGYDALLTVEHDMLLPVDAIQKLWDTNVGVVYGVYMLRHGTPTLNAWQYIGNRNIGMSLSLYPKEVRAAWKRGWAEVSGTGWGCTLIRREVLERTAVRQSGDNDAGDTAFGMDCVRAGIRQIARFDVECGHITDDGEVLYPLTKHGGIVYRVYALRPVTANVNGNSLVMRKGSYYTLPVESAIELARAGYVTITNEDDSQQVAGEREQPDITAREMAIDPKVAKRSTRGKHASAA